MGNCLINMLMSVSGRYVVTKLTGLLDHVIGIRVNDEKKYKNKSCVNLNEINKLEQIMDIVRTQSSAESWDDIVQRTVTIMTEKSASDALCIVTGYIATNVNTLKPHHVFTLYTLMVDAISCYVQERPCVDTIHVLQKVHTFINCKTTISVLEDVLSVLKYNP